MSDPKSDYEQRILPAALRALAEDAKDAMAVNVLTHAAEALEWQAIEVERLRISHARYEALRLCSPRSFGDLYERNIAGKRFDDLVDELVKQTPPYAAAAIAAEREARSWQPIKTAPRDESQILTWRYRTAANGYWYQTSFWSPELKRFVGWPVSVQPTHWMSLPAPPE